MTTRLTGRGRVVATAAVCVVTLAAAGLADVLLLLCAGGGR